MNTHSKTVGRLSAIAGGVFALSLALTACGGDNDTPDGAVKNFMDNGMEDWANAFKDGDFDKVAEVSAKYFCEEDVNGIKDLADQFAELSDDQREQALDSVGDEFDLGDDWSYKIGDVEKDGDTATVNVTLTIDGEDNESPLTVQKDGDEWQLCGNFSGDEE